MTFRQAVAVLSLILLAAALAFYPANRSVDGSSGNVARDAKESTQTAGKFDFFVLALSWSPSFCEVRGARADARQCGSEPHAFIVHGLWPQFERGYPEFCGVDRRAGVTQRQMNAVFDLMPSSGLIVHQWRKHGTCSGMAQDEFFTLLRAARKRVVIPPQYRNPDSYRSVDPDVVEKAFLEVNPELGHTGIAVTCDRRYLRDVHICMTRDLEFRACHEVDGNRCRRSGVVMPPVRAR